MKRDETEVVRDLSLNVEQMEQLCELMQRNLKKLKSGYKKKGVKDGKVEKDLGKG